jgi:acetoin utilization protein AcuB
MTTVSQWMTKTVVTAKPYDTVRQARELLSKHRINQLPVVASNKLVGIVSDRDIRDAYPSSLRLLRGKDLDDFADAHIIKEVMTYKVITVSSQTSLHEAAQRLRRQRLGALPVMDNEQLVGIITRSDVLDAYLAEPSQATL